MTTLTPEIDRVVSEVSRRARPDGVFSLFLDFDGTLVPIAANPSMPRLAPETRKTLQRISERKCCVTTVISGRAVDDLEDRVGIDGIIYAGNHGLRIRGRGLEFVEPGAVGLRERLAKISRDIGVTLRPVRGVLVEEKGLTTSVHYRQVDDRDLTRVEGAVRAAVARGGDGFHVNSGKKVFEIVPRTNWHKGAAARWINRRLGLDEHLTIYLGDDTTDENAFSTLLQAVTVQVGTTDETGAEHQLPDPEAVHDFLKWMADFPSPGLAQDGGR